MKNIRIFYLKFSFFGDIIFCIFELACFRNMKPKREKTTTNTTMGSATDIDSQGPHHLKQNVEGAIFLSEDRPIVVK